MPVTFDSVRQVALSLERVEEGTSYGTPGFKVRGALFLRFRPDIKSLVLRTDFEQRREMMAADPETYYITDHYLEYPYVLVRLSRLHPEALRDLLLGAWRMAAASKRGTAPRGSKARRSKQ